MKDKNFWKDRNVYVTGATGFLGSWLVQELAGSGANVTVLIRDTVPKSNLILNGSISKINIVHSDLEDRYTVERSINEYEIDSVFHLGAQAIVGTANRNPMSTFESNVRGTWNVLEACRNNPLVKRIVVASSDKAYGEHDKLPYTEETPLRGLHPYDVSKSCADMIAQGYYHTYGLPVGITRCGNFYGGGDLNFSRIIPGTIKALFFGQRPVIRSDGTPKRDYNYIKDVVDAYLTLAEKLDDKKIQGRAFNIGRNEPVTVLDVVKKIMKIMECSMEPEILNEAVGEIQHQYLSAEKANRVLGWKSKYDLMSGLKETVQWYREFFKKW